METVPYVKKPWMLYTGIATLFFSGVIGTCVVGANLNWFNSDDAFLVGIMTGIVGLITVVALMSYWLTARLTEKLLERGFHRTPRTKSFWRSSISTSPAAEAAFRAHSRLRSTGYFSFAAVREAFRISKGLSGLIV
jgi:hypothetical protein